MDSSSRRSSALGNTIERLVLDVRIMRGGTSGFAIALAAVVNLALLNGSDKAWLGTLTLECLTPLLFVPVFAGILLGDVRAGTHEVLLSLPRCHVVYAKRAIATFVPVLLVIFGESLLWHGHIGVSLAEGMMLGLPPTLLLGSLAYLASLLSLSESVAMGLAFGLWMAEQTSLVARLAAESPFYYVYLCPATRVPQGALQANHVVVTCAAALVFLAVHMVIARPELLLRGSGAS